jgi:hypothetical protein
MMIICMATQPVTVTLEDVNVARAVDQAVRRENARWAAEGYAAWLVSDDPVAAEHRTRRATSAVASVADLDAAHKGAR